MADTLQPLKALNEQEQAVQFYRRERRRSLEDIAELFRTHKIDGGTQIAVATIPAATFPVRDTEVTFRTAIRFDDNTDPRTGLIFEFGSSASGIAMWIEDDLIGFRAGDTGDDAASGTFDNTVQWPATLELDLVCAVRPGLGLIALWANGKQILRVQSVTQPFGSGEWAASSAGSFASAFSGTIPADVGESGAPANFAVIEPLSVYISQRPRQFITPV